MEEATEATWRDRGHLYTVYQSGTPIFGNPLALTPCNGTSHRKIPVRQPGATGTSGPPVQNIAT